MIVGQETGRAPEYNILIKKWHGPGISRLVKVHRKKGVLEIRWLVFL